jgi:hypothetical protein
LQHQSFGYVNAPLAVREDDMPKIAKLAWLALVYPLISGAQPTSPKGTPVQITVTLGHHYGHEPPELRPDDLIVTQRWEPVPVTNLVPLTGDRAALELFVLVDNCSNCEPGSKFEELRRFIDSQPPTTAIGIAYIDNGALEMALKPTLDRERAVKALNTPAGSKPASPFVALKDLIQAWPHGSSRRAVVLISNGMNPAAKDELQEPSAEAAIEAAERAGVTVYAIYHPSADYLTSDSSKIYAGQVQLAHLAVETGGEAYFLGFGPLPSLAPFLADISDHFAHQYLLEFLANTGEKPNTFQPVTVKAKIPEVELMAPGSVWIPGPGSSRPTGKY